VAMAKEPTSPNDCRARAAKCAKLMQHVSSPVLKRLLRERAALWVKLALELERAEGLTADMPGASRAAGGIAIR
jgi:hypothetical protein